MDALILDMLEWLSARPRPRADIVATWGTSCPHLPVWEDAYARGFIRRIAVPDGPDIFAVSDDGLEFLAERRPTVVAMAASRARAVAR